MDFKEKRKKMFRIGSYVMYGKRGVCKVEDIGKFFKESMGDSREYYKLSPIFVKGDQVYIPVENQVFMRQVISSDAAKKYLEVVPEIQADTFTCRQQTRLAEHYKEMMDTYDINVLLSLIKGIYVKQYQAGQKNKKLCQIDQRYLKSAEEITYGEFAIALESTPEKIKTFVKDQIFCQIQG